MGRAGRGTELTAAERSALIARYRTGAAALVAALEGATPAELDWQPAPDAWTAREVVHHLEDAELTGAVRLRRLLAEETPAIPAFDEALYRHRLRYASRPIAASLRAIATAHACTLELLEGLAEADWLRAGTHSEDGAYSVERWLAFHAANTPDHTAAIHGLRQRRPSPRSGGVPGGAAPGSPRLPHPALR